MAKPADSLASFTNRLVALETRVNALETKDAELAAAVSNLTGRVAALEAGDYGVRLDTLRAEVDELSGIVYRLYNQETEPFPEPEVFPPVGGLNVMDYGAHADGTTNDLDHIQAAITAAAGEAVYFPAGTYLLSSTLTVPTGTKLIGADMATTTLKGAVRFGSTSTFTDLKMGDTGKYTAAVSGANTTTFTRCQFVGGTATSLAAPLILNVSCHHLTFTDCTVDEGGGLNNGITINAVGDNIHDILFDGCHVLHSGRIGFECTNRPPTGVTTGYYNVDLVDCIFEAQGSEGVSYDGSYAHDCLIDGVTIKGAGYQPGQTWAWGASGLEINRPSSFTVTGLTIYHVLHNSLNIETSGSTFTNCTFDETVSYMPGVGKDTYTGVVFASDGIQNCTFTNCVMKSGDIVSSSAIGRLWASHGNDFSGCTTTGYSGAVGTWVLYGDNSGNQYPAGDNIVQQ